MNLGRAHGHMEARVSVEAQGGDEKQRLEGDAQVTKETVAVAG